MKNRNRNRKGAVLPLIAVMMVALILLLGLMVELNWLYSTRFEAQSASDLATRSALAKLYNHEGQFNEVAVSDAKQFGVDIYSLNFNRSAPIEESDLVFGDIDANRQFEEIDSNDGNSRDITAARIIYNQRYKSMLGTLIAKNEVDLGVLSVAEAAKVDMVLALDASRSMAYDALSTRKVLPPGATSIHAPPIEGSRWFALRDATEKFMSKMEEADINFGLVTFGGGSPHRTVYSPLDDQYSRIELEIDKAATNAPLVLDVLDSYTELTALGSGTSIYDAIEDSVTVIERTGSPARRYIVLFTDGRQFARGRPDELAAAQHAADRGVTIYTIGYNLDDGFLKDIAEITGGQSFSVYSPTELEQVFGKISSLVRTRVIQ